MEIAHYITMPCPACLKVEEEYMDEIEKRYEVIEHDVNESSGSTYVELWSSITNKLPTFLVEGNEELLVYIGVDGGKELYKRCEGWLEYGLQNRKMKNPETSSRSVLEGESLHRLKKDYASPKI